MSRILGFFAPRTVHNNRDRDRDHATLSETSRLLPSTTSDKRKSSTPVPRGVTHTLRPRPVIKSTLVVESPVSLGWQDPPRLTKTPWELGRHKKQKSSKVAGSQLPTKVFRILPKEVYSCIIVQLEQLHLRQDQTCPACYLKDLHSLSLVSRAWDKATRAQMYRRVLLFANDKHTKIPKLKIRGTNRLKLLRGTLRNQPALARYVLELHLTGFQALYRNASLEQEEIGALVASLVMACPNLERLIGFHTPLTQSFDRLSHALSTRANMNERIWSLNESNTDLSYEEDVETDTYYLPAHDPTERFLELNSNHALLKTLVLHQDNPHSGATLNFRAIIGTLRQLPDVQNLSISNLPAISFTNMTLNALPANLRSLRLENLPGVDDKGLQRFATSCLMNSIETLLLIDLELSDLVTISKVFSANPTKLRSFSIAQYRAPGLSSRNSLPAALSSPTVQYIHWEIRLDVGPVPTLPLSSSPSIPEEQSFPFTNLEPISCLATFFLATSIKDNFFPSLRRIRIPHDPQGLVQALCKPLATALLPCDMPILQSMTSDGTGSVQSKASDDSVDGGPFNSRADSAIDSPTSSVAFIQAMPAPTRSRLATEARILAARKNAFVTIRVYDPSDELQVDKEFGGYVGQLHSQITYDVKADNGRTFGAAIDANEDRNEWITNVEDLAYERDAENFGLSGGPHSICEHRNGAKAVMVEEMFWS